MKKTEVRRQIVIDKLADHLLVHGMRGASLRQLAAAAGMSDRMLLHYFVNKEELLTAALVLVTERLIGILESGRSEQIPFQVLLPHLAGMIKDHLIRPYLKLWLELVSLTTEEEESYRAIAREICDCFFDWIASALKVEREEDRRPLASLAFATIEGFVLLDALGSGSLINSALEGVTLLEAVMPQFHITDFLLPRC
jgi:AcrR family transcriptional regulator